MAQKLISPTSAKIEKIIDPTRAKIFDFLIFSHFLFDSLIRVEFYSKDITLQHLEIIEARENLFNDWLKLKGKLGGQHKVPRLSNSREHIEQLLKLNA